MTTNALHMQISPGSNFADAFWDDNFKGVDIIFHRLKRSKETCEEIKRLYESRFTIQPNKKGAFFIYIESLELKLNKNMVKDF
ncbi:hypothetical protein BCV71DRAFT_284835 [Rhizopus microsporus]|uniref:Uncharacterized protein n=1 Tax=Rhizopus microsporus TaxID=58291 RepID=A0A1X0S3A1_RHIZD|nr:hypothetical protein BCV71DRAFT_284835 [Rhizopus microsporus]